VGPFALLLNDQSGIEPPGVTVHKEAHAQTFDLQLLPPGRPVLACGTFHGPP
jgi:hypothetical protein